MAEPLYLDIRNLEKEASHFIKLSIKDEGEEKNANDQEL